MINNYFFLGAAILAFGGAIGHAYIGHSSVLAEIRKSGLKHAVFLFLHQTTWFMVLSGILLGGGSMGLFQSGMITVAWFIFGIFGGHFLVYLVSSLAMNPKALSQLVFQLMFVIIYLGTIYLGIQQASRELQG